MRLRQLPWRRPIEVERTFVEPNGDKKCNFLLEKRRDIRFIIGFNDSKCKNRRGMYTELKASRMSMKAAVKYSLLLNDW